MRRRAVTLFALVALCPAQPALAETPDRAAEGRAIAQAFGAELKTALQSAVASGGPLAGIRVCNEQAPQLAAAAAARSGAAVGRTSLRLRNPGNAPDAHQREVLQVFAAALEQGAQPPLERLDTLPDGRIRYMSAIVVQPQCLACHGPDLAPPLAEAIAGLYPDDAARGYQPGELRGAFTITWPAE